MDCSRHGLIYRLRTVSCAAALAVGVSACSTHPLPDDVTRTSTVDIVKSIRCEALAGIDSLSPAERAKAEPIINATAVGFDFTFNISESNGINGDPKNSFLTFKNGTKSTFDFTGSASLQRSNLRRFTIIEPLADLRKPENRALCANRTAGANWTYPIAGAIGMDEVVRTYLKLEMLSELQQARGKAANVVFADDLSFTTHFDAGARTTLVLDAVVGRLRVTNASIKANASRDDAHSVIVALTRQNINVDESAALDRGALLASGKVRDPRTQVQLIQVDAEARARVAMELYRRRSLNDVDNEPAEALGQRLLDVLKVP